MLAQLQVQRGAEEPFYVVDLNSAVERLQLWLIPLSFRGQRFSTLFHLVNNSSNLCIWERSRLTVRT